MYAFCFQLLHLFGFPYARPFLVLANFFQTTHFNPVEEAHTRAAHLASPPGEFERQRLAAATPLPATPLPTTLAGAATPSASTTPLVPPVLPNGLAVDPALSAAAATTAGPLATTGVPPAPLPERVQQLVDVYGARRVQCAWDAGLRTYNDLVDAFGRY
jgi:hypothetical protein